jgi:hypothetical protein
MKHYWFFFICPLFLLSLSKALYAQLTITAAGTTKTWGSVDGISFEGAVGRSFYAKSILAASMCF